MANTTIQLKKSGTASSVPSSLAFGELAINYADGKIYYKAANGSILSFSSGGGTGTSSNSFSTINANGTFLVADSPTSILSITPGYGIQIVGNAINDIVTISANINSLSQNCTSQLFTANGSQTTFTLASSIAEQNNVIVSVDGLLQIPAIHYSITGTTLTFTSAPLNKSNVEARSVNPYLNNDAAAIAMAALAANTANAAVTTANTALNRINLILMGA